MALVTRSLSLPPSPSPFSQTKISHSPSFSDIQNTLKRFEVNLELFEKVVHSDVDTWGPFLNK